MSKDMDFCHLLEIYLTNMDTALETATKKGFHKAAETTGEFLENNIVSKIVKSVEEIIIPPVK